jgi:hypothetical protein
MTVQERMLKRLRELLEPEGLVLPESTQLRRTHAGTLQRNAGAWSWFAWTEDGRSLGGRQRDIGSNYPMSVVLRCKNVTVSKAEYGIHLDPCDPCIARYGRVRF